MYGDLMSMDNFTNSASRDIFDQFKAYPVAFFTDSKEGKDNYFTDMDRCISYDGRKLCTANRFRINFA